MRARVYVVDRGDYEVKDKNKVQLCKGVEENLTASIKPYFDTSDKRKNECLTLQLYFNDTAIVLLLYWVSTGVQLFSRGTLLYFCTAFLQLLLFKEYGKMLVSFQQIKEVHNTGCSLNIVFYGKF